MSVRLAFLAALATSLPLPAQPPPPLSRSYVEAVRDVLQLEESDAARLEQKLAANPEDSANRTTLMAYYGRADRTARPADRAKRARLALWLIEHHPESEVLHAPISRFSSAELTAPDYSRALRLWEAATQAKPHDARIQWNAASWVEGLDQGLYLHYLEATAAADPNHPYALRPLAHLYALSVVEGGPLAARSQAGLEASHNVWVLGNAANMLQIQYNLRLERGQPTPRAAELAERYFLRARAIDPNLDRATILPQAIPSQPPPRPQSLPPTSIRRLPIDAFPNLPPALAGVLRSHKCEVPQPDATGPPRNVIRGEFFAKGEESWAVLCSVNTATSLLVFRSPRDTAPVTVTTSEITYERDITPVGRDFIMRHYRAYGGPRPPTIDHNGIDDAFLEKASVTWYFHDGRWLRLQGAD
jgi:hypothetical protein